MQLTFSALSLSAVKRDLLAQFPAPGMSGRLSQALAAGLGYRTNQALVTELRQGGDALVVTRTIDDAAFAARLSDLVRRPVSPEARHLFWAAFVGTPDLITVGEDDDRELASLLLSGLARYGDLLEDRFFVPDDVIEARLAGKGNLAAAALFRACANHPAKEAARARLLLESLAAAMPPPRDWSALPPPLDGLVPEGVGSYREFRRWVSWTLAADAGEALGAGLSGFAGRRRDLARTAWLSAPERQAQVAGLLDRVRRTS